MGGGYAEGGWQKYLILQLSSLGKRSHLGGPGESNFFNQWCKLVKKLTSKQFKLENCVDMLLAEVLISKQL